MGGRYLRFEFLKLLSPLAAPLQLFRFASVTSAGDNRESYSGENQCFLTPLQQAMRQKLISSRFRHLNEQLYTTPSEKAVELFNANPELFDEYQRQFKLGSKPASHLAAMAELDDEELLEGLPEPLQRLLEAIQKQLESIPE